MKLENPRGHIIFDCDGTLISSQNAVFMGIQYVAETFLNKSFSMEEIKNRFNADFHTLWENFEINSKSKEVEDELTRLWKEHAISHQLDYGAFEEIEFILKEFIKKDFLLYVWTGRDRASTLKILKQLNLMKYFLDLRAGDDTIAKPHPMGIEELVGDIDKSQVVVVGDSYTDIMGAKEFGCRAVAATWCVHADHQALMNYNPCFMAKSPKEFYEYVLKELPERD